MASEAREKGEAGSRKYSCMSTITSAVARGIERHGRGVAMTLKSGVPLVRDAH
jgi:hypothetical protein